MSREDRLPDRFSPFSTFFRFVRGCSLLRSLSFLRLSLYSGPFPNDPTRETVRSDDTNFLFPFEPNTKYTLRCRRIISIASSFLERCEQMAAEESNRINARKKKKKRREKTKEVLESGSFGRSACCLYVLTKNACLTQDRLIV